MRIHFIVTVLFSNRRSRPRLLAVAATLLALFAACTPGRADGSLRSRECIDADWRFAFGHATDPEKDFGYSTVYHTDLSKAGYGDGAAAAEAGQGGVVAVAACPIMPR